MINRQECYWQGQNLTHVPHETTRRISDKIDTIIPLETKEFFMYLGFALMIGMVNLIVSFSLALNVALGARGAKLGSIWKLLKALGGKFLKRPKEFLIPPA